MDENNDKKEHKQPLGARVENEFTGMPRRTVLKALAGLPVAGFLGIQVWRKSKFESQKKNSVINQLGLDAIEFPESDYGTRKPSGDIIRVGMIGFGSRGIQLSRSLGFMHPDEVKERQQNNTLNSVFEYPNHDLILQYSGSLSSSRERGRVFIGHDASMELGSNLIVSAAHICF